MHATVTQDRFGWRGAIGRIVGFSALFILLAIALGAGYSLLPRSQSAVSALLATSVPAAAALIAGVVLLRAIDHRPAAALGIGVSVRTPLLTVTGLLIGAAALTVAALLLLATGMLTYASQTGSMSQWLFTVAAQCGLFAIAALAEEAIFRGYPFQVLVHAFGAPAAIVLSSLAFAWVHGNNPGIDLLALCNLFLAGVLLAIAYLKSMSLWFVTALHLGWNWAMATLFDLPVSGIEEFNTPLYEPTVRGADWFSGGNFGPEGGLIGTIGFAVALLLVLRLPIVRPDPGVLNAGPLAARALPQESVSE
jgi:uncharacterized protein